MKTFLKIFVCAVAVTMAFLACNDTDSDSNGSISSSSSTQSSNFCENPQSSNEGELPAMDCRVVSYQHMHLRWGEYREALGSQGLTTDKDILKSGFPYIFNDEQTECNYFALYKESSDSFRSYLILSQDMALYNIFCTWKEFPGIGVGIGSTGIYEAMLICDDEAGTLKESIGFGSMHFYEDPNWECESGAGGPSEEDVYFGNYIHKFAR